MPFLVSDTTKQLDLYLLALNFYVVLVALSLPTISLV